MLAALEAQGWSRTNGEDHAGADGRDASLTFQHDACAGTLLVATLERNGEAAHAFELLATDTDRLFYVYRGVLSPEPSVAALWRERWNEVLRSLGWTTAPAAAVIGVIAPQDCIIVDQIRWPSE